MKPNSSKVIGKTISQLITLAQHLKAQENGRTPDPMALPGVYGDPPTSSYMYKGSFPDTHLAIEKLTVEVKKITGDRDRWRGMARKQAQAVKEYRRMTLSNFSIQEIEKELMRRLDIGQK